MKRNSYQDTNRSIKVSIEKKLPSELVIYFPTSTTQQLTNVFKVPRKNNCQNSIL